MKVVIQMWSVKLLKVYVIVMLVEKPGFLDVLNFSAKMKYDMVQIVKDHANVQTQDVMIMGNAVKIVTKTTKDQIVKSASVKIMELVKKINVCAPTNLKENSVKCQTV
jgi:CxxC motif-containing protein